MAQLYRKSALDKISNPEQLDKALTVTTPLSWLALVALTLVVIVTLVWSIVGRIPVTITAEGVITNPTGVNAVYAREKGTVKWINISEGSELHIDVPTPVLSYTDSNGEEKTLYSDQVGTVSSVNVNVGDKLENGTLVARVTPSVTHNKTSGYDQVVVCYIDLRDRSKIHRQADGGLFVNIYLTGEDSQKNGYMVARVINIDATIDTEGSHAKNVLGSNANTVAVTCELILDDSTASGYFWSNSSGAARAAESDDTIVSAKFIVEEIPPIKKLSEKLAELWGGK
ncbi:MAG: hypothetical protein IK095_09155 [Oscillospiraceae bacterium]|nr:hypothetical protein [Oscillospiraceae bacterium]